MKRLMALLLGTMLSAPTLAQDLRRRRRRPANGGVRYVPATQHLGEGRYRAEVRRSGAAARCGRGRLEQCTTRNDGGYPPGGLQDD